MGFEGCRVPAAAAEGNGERELIPPFKAPAASSLLGAVRAILAGGLYLLQGPFDFIESVFKKQRRRFADQGL